MNLFKAYKYFFYRTYLWQLNMFGEANNPKYTAILANSLCVYFNLLTLTVFFQIVTAIKMRLENIYAVIGIFILILVNYFIFLYNNKSEAIIAEFSSESEIQQKRWTIWCWVYVILTYVSFFGSVSILFESVPFL